MEGQIKISLKMEIVHAGRCVLYTPKSQPRALDDAQSLVASCVFAERLNRARANDILLYVLELTVNSAIT